MPNWVGTLCVCLTRVCVSSYIIIIHLSELLKFWTLNFRATSSPSLGPVLLFFVFMGKYFDQKRPCKLGGGIQIGENSQNMADDGKSENGYNNIFRLIFENKINSS